MNFDLNLILSFTGFVLIVNLFYSLFKICETQGLEATKRMFFIRLPILVVVLGFIAFIKTYCSLGFCEFANFVGGVKCCGF